MTEESVELEAGAILAGRYRIVRLVGQGGMGAVYEAVDTELDRRVALKALLPRLHDQPRLLGRFQREARAASRIRSDHVVRVLAVDATPSGLPFMVMELLEGNDLAQELTRRGRLPIEEAVDYVLQACAGMALAHALGVVHRDLKPSNLFLCEDGGRRVVKILDFGISKLTSEAEPEAGAIELPFGTPVYMSPEQIRSARLVDARTDVWALGVILYELLAGRPPFSGGATAVAAAIVTEAPPQLSVFRPGIPAALEEAVHQALEKELPARHPDVGALAAALSPFSL